MNPSKEFLIPGALDGIAPCGGYKRRRVVRDRMLYLNIGLLARVPK